jgi:hypothetical protein
MATSTKTKAKSLLPPEEKFWKRYSPHHEFPLAGMTSLCVHALVLGFLLLGGLAFLLRERDDAARPASMDVVMVSSGSGNDGAEGAEGAPGLPGAPGPEEAVKPASVEARQAPELDKAPTPELAALPKAELAFPTEPMTPPTKDDTESTLESIGKEVENAIKRGETKPAPPGAKAAPTVVAKRSGPGGGGGAGVKGVGPGSGAKGLGPGGGGAAGGPVTQAQIFAGRWNFDLSGDARQHADKLAAIGFVVALPDPRDAKRLLLVKNLRTRPVRLEAVAASKYESAVKKQNTKLDSVTALSRELQLPFVPAQVIILIPEALKQKMADEEVRAARQVGKDLEKIRQTWFDFRLENGAYEPFVFRME